jgi:hypothetical protein
MRPVGEMRGMCILSLSRPPLFAPPSFGAHPPPPLLFLFLFRPGFAPVDVSSGEPWRSEERGVGGVGGIQRWMDGWRDTERNKMYVDKC